MRAAYSTPPSWDWRTRLLRPSWRAIYDQLTASTVEHHESQIKAFAESRWLTIGTMRPTYSATSPSGRTVDATPSRNPNIHALRLDRPLALRSGCAAVTSPRWRRL